MTDVERILAHPLYRDAMRRIAAAEEKRIYCRHDLSHVLDVARILYILVLERALPYTKNTVYAAALLHDIGRSREYAGAEPHHEASARMAASILADAGYDDEQTAVITEAIRWHNREDEHATELGRLLFAADKMCRCCFVCEAREQCNWNEEMKNRTIQY